MVKLVQHKLSFIGNKKENQNINAQLSFVQIVQNAENLKNFSFFVVIGLLKSFLYYERTKKQSKDVIKCYPLAWR